MTIQNKFIVVLASLIASSSIEAFTPISNNAGLSTQAQMPLTTLSLHASSNEDNNDVTERRAFLRNIGAIALGTAGGFIGNTDEASASYTGYTQREKDWEERKEKGEVTYSTSKDLKRQLREIAPMNQPKSQIFCPNGASSGVSPLMENKCNDVEAMPSVFGRTDDIMGNSIPGRNPTGAFGGTTSLNADTGGFPSYR
mmetsp:Transcript_10502/g.13315  ORF Transcript_10502/g.13315 Transcript_10502/m.13315 type:complete len:198 (+) Transcript_10502:153-746(+)